MIELIKEYTYCKYIDPKEIAEYIFECAENFVNEKLQNETIDLNYFSGTQVWNMPPTIRFKNKIPYSEEWTKDFGRAFYDIKKNKLIIKLCAIQRIVCDNRKSSSIFAHKPKSFR